MGNFSRGSASSWDIFATIFFLITVRLTLTSGAQLTIKPEVPVIKKAIDQDVFLICQLGEDDPNRITDLQWLTPTNETIPLHVIERNGQQLSTQWWPNKSLVLVIPSLKESGAGTYTCTGLYGTERLSKSVTVKTFVEITWQDAPVEQFPTLNKDYKVKCKVVANPAPFVDWLKDGDKIETNDRYVIEADGLLIKNAQESDDGVYTCRAYITDIGSMIKRNIRVEVHIAPSFNNSVSPIIHEVVEGEVVDITCQASGKPPPSYTWIKSSRKANLGTIGDRFTVNDQTGTLTINSVKPDDNGELVCEARNAAGLDTQKYNLVVLVKPSIYELKNISLPTGRTATLECKATGNPIPTITFRKLSSLKAMISGVQPHDNRIVIEQRVDEQKREVVGSLIISSLQRADDGLYTCIAKNKGGEAIKNGHLTVEFAPTFASTPMKEAWSWDKRPINLTCIAESIPNATISWRFNERLIDGSPYFRQFGSGPQSSLLVTPSSPEYYGNYKCEAKNTIGSSHHTIRLFEAHVPGGILQSKLGVATATTISFTFIGPSDIGGRPIKAFVAQYKKERQSWAEAKNRTWSFDSPYILENLEPQTKYNFRFAAVNEVGIGSFGAQHEYVMPKRSFPEEPKILNNYLPEDNYGVSPYSDRFELRWKVPADNGEPIDFYDIKCCIVDKPANGDEWQTIDDQCYEHRTAGSSSFELSKLSPDTFYKIELRAHNSIGYSTPGQAIIKTARGSDSMIRTTEGSTISSAMFIGIVFAVLIAIFIIIDISCFFVNDNGLLWLLCGKSSRKPREDDAKIGSEGKELLNSGHREGKIMIDSATPMIDNSMKKESAVQYDGKKAVSKTGTGFIGKDSAV